MPSVLEDSHRIIEQADRCGLTCVRQRSSRLGLGTAALPRDLVNAVRLPPLRTLKSNAVQVCEGQALLKRDLSSE